MTTPEARKRRDHEIIALLLLILTVVGVSLVRQFQINDTLHDQVAAVHNSQVSACEASLRVGGVRYIVAQQLREQLRQSQTFDYSKFFPNVPADQLATLLKNQERQERQEIQQLLNVNCEAQFRT